MALYAGSIISRLSAFGRWLHVKHGLPCSAWPLIAEALRECGRPHCAAGVVTAELQRPEREGRIIGRRVPPTALLDPRSSLRSPELLPAGGPVGAVTDGLDGFRERYSYGGFGEDTHTST